jgi:hypothetical protein
MWECPKCHERHEDSFEVCWKCGTSETGVEDPDFQTADRIDPASLEQSAKPPIEELAPATPWEAASEAGPKAYEFSPEQNEVIASLASNMKMVGVVALISGGLLVVAGCVLSAKGAASAVIQGAVAVVVGGFTVQAAGAFREIVDSRGDDISHLMTALGTLRTLYRLQVILLLCLALVLLSLSFGLVATSGRW